MIIDLTDGTSYKCELQVLDDLHNERPGMKRLFWMNPNDSCGCPAVGYCSSGGSYRTVREAIADGVRRFGVKAKRVR